MAAEFDEPLFGGEPVFDDDFVKGAAFTEPSALERARPPGRRERRRARRAARRAQGGGNRSRSPWRRRNRTPSHRSAVVQVIAGVLVLFAISFALWWWNSGSRDEEPVRPIVPTITNSPAPAPTTAAPTDVPEV